MWNGVRSSYPIPSFLFYEAVSSPVGPSSARRPAIHVCGGERSREFQARETHLVAEKRTPLGPA